MEARNRTLPDWMTRIRTRQLVLPRFQRMEAWGYREVTDLLQMAVQGLPVGALLVLQVGDSLPFVSRPLETAPDKGERIAELLLDGQQRLTAIWRALNNSYPDRTYYAEYSDGKDAEKGWQISSVSRWHRNGTRYPIWADDPAQCWDRRSLPLDLLRPDNETGYKQWAQRVAKDNTELLVWLLMEIPNLRQKVNAFNLPFLELPVGTPRDVVLDVFIKLNTRSVRLTTFDIVVALTEEEIGTSLHDLVDSLNATVPALKEYDEPKDIALNALALLQDRVPNQTGYLGLDFQRMADDWPLVENGARVAVAFLEQECVFDSSRLPTESILAPLVALWAKAPTEPDARGNANILLRKYLWRAFFTNRYERAAATAALQDYRALRDVLDGKLQQSSVPCFNEAQHPLPTVEALLQASWPKQRDRLARAVLLLSLRGGARDIAEDHAISRAELAQREYHHLFPVAFLRNQGFDESLAYSALNCALISWRTNRTISAKNPVEYLLERAEASALGAPEIRSRLASHGINYEALANGQYEDFLKARAATAEVAMKALCNGRAWKPFIDSRE